MTPDDITIISCKLVDITPARDEEMRHVRQLHHEAGFRQVFVRGLDRTMGELMVAANLDAQRNERTGHVVALADADIELDSKTALLAEQLTRDTCWALSRWEPEVEKLVPPAKEAGAWCQGSWWFRWPFRAVKHLDLLKLGRAGVDNRFAHELLRAGYHVTNPALTVRTTHHRSKYRGPERDETVPGPYAPVTPTRLEE